VKAFFVVSFVAIITASSSSSSSSFVPSPPSSQQLSKDFDNNDYVAIDPSIRR